MKFNLFFYGIGFLILIFCNQFIKDIDNDRNYQNLINQRNQEIQKILQDI